MLQTAGGGGGDEMNWWKNLLASGFCYCWDMKIEADNVNGFFLLNFWADLIRMHRESYTIL